MVLAALVRLRVAGVPLERDEGEYAYAGQLILQGIPPYQLVYNMKFPGTYYAMAIIQLVFGQTAWGIHAGLMIVNGATTIVLFLLGRRLLGTFGGTIGAIAFTLLSLDRWVMGVFAHATHFVILPALAGLLVLLRAIDSKRLPELLAAGMLLGTAVLMKQQGIFFLLLAFALVLWKREAGSSALTGVAIHTAILAVGAAIPFAFVCATFIVQGVFGKFWFWTFEYAREYVSEIPLPVAWENLAAGWNGVTQATLPVWLLASSGVVLIWLVRWTREARVFLIGLLCASMAAVATGFYFRPHYFILALPVVALLAAAACVSVKRALERVLSPATGRLIASAIFGIVVAAYVIDEQEYLVSLSNRDLSREAYGMNPFVEAPDIARYVRDHTSPADRIAVLGSEPEIYFYARRKSATGYIYTYGMMEQQRYAARMQEEMIGEVERAHPRYIVFVAMQPSWLVRKADEKILRWAHLYTRQCYDLVGVADIHSLEQSEVLWDSAATAYRPRSENVVYTFRRKSDISCTVANQLSDLRSAPPSIRGAALETSRSSTAHLPAPRSAPAT